MPLANCLAGQLNRPDRRNAAGVQTLDGRARKRVLAAKVRGNKPANESSRSDTGGNTGDPWQKMAAIGSSHLCPREAYKWLIGVAYRQPQSSVEMASAQLLTEGL